jgi:hypothetical protein
LIGPAPGSPFWHSLIGADGAQVVANGKFKENQSALYFTDDDLGSFNRIVFDANGNQISPSNSASFALGSPINCSYNGSIGGCNANKSEVKDGKVKFVNISPFLAPIVLNRADPTKIAIAPGNDEILNGNFVYVGQDTADASKRSVDLRPRSARSIPARR